MNEEAAAVLRALAEGVDPRTGGPLRMDDACRDPGVREALTLAIDALTRPAPRRRSPGEPPRRDLPANAGRPWTAEEDARLREEFQIEKSPKTLAARHGRTTGSLNSRLVRLGLVPPGTRSPV